MLKFPARESTVTTRTAQDGSAHVTLPYGSYAVTVTSPGFEAAKIIDFPIHTPKPDLGVVLVLDGHAVEYDDYSGGLKEVETITSDLPIVIEPKVTEPLWSWFSNCANNRYIGFQVVLARKLITNSSFPICPVDDLANTVKGQQRIVTFSFRGGHVFQISHDPQGYD